MGTISVSNLGKAYKQYPTRWSRLLEWLTPGHRPRHKLKWVLKDINFHVEPGEAVGIIGINGAGKSTLLKMITGTTQPTTGEVQMQGRVAALLELGMGFHPDFTGRQNAFMAGQLLGYSVDEIACLMPEIEAFAEIGDYIEQPVRVYSSGMQVRLAFSVATAIRPDILIVDEALSVGDAYFQHKSMARIREFQEKGTTLLFVSHDKGAVQAVCNRAILLESGHIALQGTPETVFDYYNAKLADEVGVSIKQVSLEGGGIQTASGDGRAFVSSIAVLDSLTHEPIEVLNVGQQVLMEFIVEVRDHLDSLVLGYGLKDKFGQVMYGVNTLYTKQVLRGLSPGDKYKFTIKFQATLGEGDYSLQVALVDEISHISATYQWIDRAKMFKVVNSDHAHFIGSCWMRPVIEIGKVD